MKVSLVAVTQPAPALQAQGIRTAEDLMVYAARVSSPQNQLNTDTGERLLRYCLRNGHWSVFETVSCTMEVETSLAIATQILRHRSFTFQQFSQRYADVSAMGFEEINPRRQDTTNRQSSHDDLSDDDKAWFANRLWEAKTYSSNAYREALARGIAKESARFLLPQSTTTRLYMSGSVRSWATYFMVRREASTQAEHREVAEAAWGVFAEQFPVVAKALGEEAVES